MLRVEHLSRTFRQPDGDVHVLQNASFELAAGRSAALTGESGSGKTTLLHLIAGLDRPDAGSITLDGECLTDGSESDWNRVRREVLSLVFQQYHLVPTLTVRDNVRLQARLAGRFDPALEVRLSDGLGIKTLMSRLPHQLSGGQQQRVAIARALMHRPRLVLADEPTGNLDEATSHEVMRLLVTLVGEAGASLLLVTHSAEMAAYTDDRYRLHEGVIGAAH